jgi:hypothetical protein
MSWVSTPRNEPFARFLEEVSGEQPPAEALVRLSPTDVAARLSQNLELFDLNASGAQAA